MSARIAVFASGGGTNLQSLLDHFDGVGREVARVALVVSDREGAGVLERARRAEVAWGVIPVRGRAADEVAGEMLGVLHEAEIDVVVLAGYLRLVPPAVVRAFRGRMLNIHPALLPAFGGAGMHGINIHRAVLEAGCTVTGATVHYVDERYDTGPILIQWPVPVLSEDTPEMLAGRVLAVEHRILPLAVEAVVQGEGRHGGGVGEPVAFGLVGAGAPGAAEVRGVLGLGLE